MSSKERKQALRERISAARSAMPPEERAARSALIAGHIIAAWQAGRFGYGEAHEPTLLVCYVPFRSEADVLPVVRWCWAQGVPVAAPRADEHRRKITLHFVAGEQDLQPGAYGIREPMLGTPRAALPPGTLMLVPGLAFDAVGRRLGYGGGYYDRLLDKHRADIGSGALTLAAPAFAVQIVDVVPTEPHDARVRFLITEDGITDCSRRRDAEWS